MQRRSFLSLLPAAASAPLLSAPRFSSYPFQLGVASGDPAADGFVIWTRLAPDPLNGGGMPNSAVNVEWRVATDERMSRVVKRGMIPATPEHAHTLHVEVHGLDPDRWYWYQFRSGQEWSPTGRSRTFPSQRKPVDRLRFAFASCQHYEAGYFTAYEHMVKENLDLIVHLGDYIYEGRGREQQVRKHAGGELQSLSDYRNRYAQYRLDKHLQTAHLLFPWIVTWDDHEVDNNYAGFNDQDGSPRETFLERRANAYQAYYEHMPLRRTCLPHGSNLTLYRRLTYGNLVEFSVLDTRQYRTDQPCGDGNKPQCAAALDPSATLLGAQQERWLFDGLTKSKAQWDVIAQQVLLAKVDRMPGSEKAYSMDQWSGYEEQRKRVLRFLSDHKPSNPIILTGDIHSNWVNDVLADFDRPDSGVIATEFVGTSISSGGDGSDRNPLVDRYLPENPHVKFYNSQRGYVSCEVTSTRWQANYRVLNQVSRPESSISTRASFVVESGRAGAQRL